MIDTLIDNKKAYKSVQFLTLIALLLFTAFLFGFNIFHFPYYESDEGTYMSQAWSLLKLGKLAPYTYNYDHAPAGWMLIAVWTRIIGGFYTFGFSINSGRVLMLVLHVLTALLIYLITTKLLNNKNAGFVSTLIYAVSPLVIYSGRRVLLDNIMIFWVLLATYLLIENSKSLLLTIISGICFGIGALSKESAVFFLPGLLYTSYVFSPPYKSIRLRNMLVLLFVLSLVIALYPLYAYYNHQLFSNGDSVSLLNTVTMQTHRGVYKILSLKDNLFLRALSDWLQEDPLIILSGLLAVIVCIFLSVKHSTSRVISMFSIMYLLFLARGGLVFEFYILPLIPWFAIAITYVGTFFFERFYKFRAVFYISLILYVLFSVFYFSTNVKDGRNIYYSDQTTPQISAVNWIIQNTPSNAKGLIDNFAFIEMHDLPQNRNRHFEYYWKAEKDPEVNLTIFNNSANSINYVVSSPQLETDALKASVLPFTRDAWMSSTSVARFNNDGWYIDIRKRTPTVE